MAKFPTYEEMSKKVAEKALNEFLYNGKSIREWLQIIASEDAISRQTVLDAMRNNYRDGGRDIDGDYIEGNYSKKLYDAIMSLPPVNQQPKTGCWEKTTDGYSYWYRCSCCGERIPKNSWGNDYFSLYCPECGVPMTESEEHS